MTTLLEWCMLLHTVTAYTPDIDTRDKTRKAAVIGKVNWKLLEIVLRVVVTAVYTLCSMIYTL